MKRWAAVITTVLILTWIAGIAVLSADESTEQALCVTEKEMAQSIQFVRITTHDSLSLYQTKIRAWSKPGMPMADAVTPEQILIKDRFWKKNLELAEKIYQLPIGWSPEYVGNFMLGICQYKFWLMKQQKNVQKFDV